jgi:hypothetical protein
MVSESIKNDKEMINSMSNVKKIRCILFDFFLSIGLNGNLSFKYYALAGGTLAKKNLQNTENKIIFCAQEIKRFL